MTSPTTALRGIAWGHTRGFVPMVATAQRFSELHPSIEMTWSKRSLQEFADHPLDKLVEQFDLLVIDHPFAGHAAERQLLLPLDEYLPADMLKEQERHSVGASHRSYFYAGHQWALAIDAAAPVSAWRQDLIDKAGFSAPDSWSDLLQMARRGCVAIPALPVDCLMHFFMFCCAGGEEPCQREAEIISEGNGVQALLWLRELIELCSPLCLQRNPIATYEAMAADENDTLAYCPFGYGYSNYARPRYAAHVLQWGKLVDSPSGTPFRSVLGGAGLAISRHCHDREAALEYLRFIVNPQCQSGLYFESGGQPAHRAAWLDPQVNARSNDFFRSTLATLDRAYLRPRYAGYIPFQDQGGEVVHCYLREGGKPRVVLNELTALYRASRRSE
jgi:multiple sugar transport system substrate-binding protein